MEKKIDFIAICVTKWHLNNLVAIINEKKLSKGNLFVLPQGNFTNSTRYRLSKSDIEPYDHLFQKVEFSKLDFSIYLFIKNIIFNLFNKKRIFIISPGSININILGKIIFLYKPKFLVIDEGTASYLSLSEHFKVYSKTSKNISFFLVIKTFIKSQFYKNINLITPVSYNYLFTSSNNCFKTNKIISRNLKKVYLEKNNTFKYFKSDKKKILLLLDFYETFGNNLFFEEIFISIINKLKLKYDIYVKPHPNSNQKFLENSKGVIILNNKLDAETITAFLNPVVIIGGISTSSFSIPAIFGIRCVSLLGIYLSSPVLDKDYQNRFIFFNENFVENIETPKTITDLINLL